jgi:hypothetical protein
MSSLLKIFENGSLRINRLDNVNDLYENQRIKICSYIEKQYDRES